MTKFDFFKTLEPQTKRLYAESLSDVSLECDTRERDAILRDIVTAQNEDEFLTSIERLERFEESYK